MQQGWPAANTMWYIVGTTSHSLGQSIMKHLHFLRPAKSNKINKSKDRTAAILLAAFCYPAKQIAEICWNMLKL
jgi:hypothetical protein